MKNESINATNYPPPPPPPQSPPKTGSRKILVVSLLLVIVIASAGVLYYLATNTGSPGGSTTNPTLTTTPTGTATPSQTGTTTPTPSATGMDNGNANLRTGWATYTITSYAGDEPSVSTLKYAVTEGTYSGTACWLMNVEMTLNQESGAIKTIMTYWVSKSTGEGIHIKTQTYMNDELVNEHEEDISPGEGGTDIPQPVDTSTATTFETITVQAGTFNCAKIAVTTPTGTSSAWYNSNIPVIGLVKIETTSGGSIQSTTELTAYGN